MEVSNAFNLAEQVRVELTPGCPANDLANRPLHHLSTAPYVVFAIFFLMAEGVGFEPTVPFEITSFQD